MFRLPSTLRLLIYIWTKVQVRSKRRSPKYILYTHTYTFGKYWLVFPKLKFGNLFITMSLTNICQCRLLLHKWNDAHTRDDDHTSHDGHISHHDHTNHDDHTSYEETEQMRSVDCITESNQDFSAAVTLDKLPMEIFQCIADFLPLRSVAYFILTRKKVASAIGHRTWLALCWTKTRDV